MLGASLSPMCSLSICPHPQPPAEFAVAVAPSTLCPPRAAVCAVKSVTTTGGDCGGTEVRLGHWATDSPAYTLLATPPHFHGKALAFCDLGFPPEQLCLAPRGSISLRHCWPDAFPESCSLTGWARFPARYPEHHCSLSPVAGGWETQYMCCSAAVGSVGCQVAKVRPAVTTPCS